MKKLMQGSISRGPNGDGVFIGGGLKWVIATVLALGGYAAGNLVPVRQAEAHAESVKVEERLNSHIIVADRESTRVENTIKEIIDRSEKRWEQHRLQHATDQRELMKALVEIGDRVGRLEPRR